MPPSQLKRLKQTLREQGVVGPQKSKKQKKQNSKNGASNEHRIQRSVALSSIREKFNPFEFTASTRGPKFDVTTNKTISGRALKDERARPGVTKGYGEEARRKTLLVEMKRRNKVGGILDRRFGENDPTMALEDKMLERFTQEKQRRHKNGSTFDLEDDDESGALTHMGQSLSLDGPSLADDFDEEGLLLSDAEDHSSIIDGNTRKRRRESQSKDPEAEPAEESGQPERKKTKQEVMKEVIAKSKLYKYERQAAKDEDDDLREELDKDMGEIHALLRDVSRPAFSNKPDTTGMNPDRAALLNGTERVKFDKDYDLRLRQLAQDKKAKPTERTKTEEERVAEESRRLQDLEAQRLRRMERDPETGLDEGGNAQADAGEELDENEGFRFGPGIQAANFRPKSELAVEDEDDFIIDDGLVASGSDFDNSDEEALAEGGKDGLAPDESNFWDGLLTEEESRRPEFLTGANGPLQAIETPSENGVHGDLAYTFTCPQSQAELLEITRTVVVQDLPTVVRRIRTLYHPQLKSENKSKLGMFTIALIDHVSYLASQSPLPPFDVLENLIRHIHSLAKTFPLETAKAFRGHLAGQNEERAMAPTVGDLTLLAAIGAIFPTSDHFHQVVTPAILTMTRYIGQKIPHSLSEYATGIYMVTICLQYQRLSKRFIPEIVGFLLNTLCAISPTKPPLIPGSFAYHDSKLPRLDTTHSFQARSLHIRDTLCQDRDLKNEIPLQVALIETSIKLLEGASDAWTGKLAFETVFSPALIVLKHLVSKPCNSKLPTSTQNVVSRASRKLERLLKHAQMALRPLELHHHRPLAIKTSIPKFEESFNPDKHYDPDRERADASKLRAEHKRERKGAMRELRKDANFIARESLREKKEKDADYEKKYKRLVAEIQGEEGQEAKAYEREKQWRRKGNK